VDATQAISQVLAYTDHINPTDADYADRRVMLRYLLQELLGEVVTDCEWTFLRTGAQKTVSAGLGYVNLDANFGQLGDYGSVHLASNLDGEPLDHVTEDVIRNIWARGDRTNTPRCFSIFGEDPTTFVKRMNFPINDQSYDVVIDYLKGTPTIDESSNVNNLKIIPEEFHQQVIIPGLRAKSLEGKGDTRWQNAEARYREGMKKMRAKFRRRQGTVTQLPSFFG